MRIAFWLVFLTFGMAWYCNPPVNPKQGLTPYLLGDQEPQDHFALGADENGQETDFVEGEGESEHEIEGEGQNDDAIQGNYFAPPRGPRGPRGLRRPIFRQNEPICPDGRYVPKHVAEGAPTPENALRFALDRLQRWERFVSVRGERWAGARPTSVTVMFGATEYRILPNVGIPSYCETVTPQIVYQCRTVPDANGNPPSCQRMPGRCIVQHDLDGHFDIRRHLHCSFAYGY